MTIHKTAAFFNPRILFAFVLCSIGVLMALFGLGAFSNLYAQPKTATRVSGDAARQGEKLSPADKEGRFVYLIEFAEPGLLRRQGHVSGETFDAKSPQAMSQRDQLMAEQAAHSQIIDGTIGRSLNATHHFLVTHSGLAARLTPAEAESVRKLSGVASIERERLYEPDTYLGPTLIGAPSIWDGSAVPGGAGTRGQGIVIAMLDSGLDPAHPSFANDAACGHTSGSPKLKSFLDCASTDVSGLCNGPSPADTNGHGTHTASTAGGNTLGPSTVPPPTPPAPYTQISGVAPCANIREYKVCPADTCPGADIQAGMNSVLLHGDAKVMNFSISGGTSPWTDNDRRKLDLVDAGVVVAASAGNTSATIVNPVGQTNHLGPWVMTVAASTRGGDASGILSATGPGSPPTNTQNIPATKGSGSPNGSTMTNVPIRHFTGQPLTAEGCSASTAFPAGFFSGSVALIQRGTCPFTEKITNAFNAGATAVIIRNNAAGTLSMSTPGQPNIPAYAIDQAAGNALVAFVDANPTTATATLQIVAVPADTLADFSLRGPSALTSLTKPDITAPGVNIYAAFPAAVTPFNYAVLSGTSMSSPHSAGSAALVRAVNPAWTAPEVKSALMMTAFEGGKKENQTTPWDADDVGNGRVDLTKAARVGVVMHETFANFLAADPSTGGDPKTLNLPSMRNMNCSPYCTWTRTVRNTRTVSSSWTTAGVPITPGFTISVSPASFSFTGSLTETRQITVTATPTANLTGAVAFGDVVLTNTGGPSPDEHLSVSIKGEPLVLSAVSRKTHGGAGTFDIPLPLTGTAGVECRTDATAGVHQIVVTFTGPVTVGSSSVTSGTGTATHSVAGSVVTINLTGVTDVQRLVVTLANVTVGSTTANVAIPMRVLAGDVSGDGSVTASDVGQTKAASGATTITTSNFRADAATNGFITASDVGLVKSKSGNVVP